jgi:hypothetical protein
MSERRAAIAGTRGAERKAAIWNRVYRGGVTRRWNLGTSIGLSSTPSWQRHTTITLRVRLRVVSSCTIRDPGRRGSLRATRPVV